ncbi:hypothetical protein [Blastococcus sp. TF02-09]|uniref:hypothetical protein n=1 Tax=Blastococcus sp. TF02-09 TaxID=2250576 RepID=UPI0011BDFF61|nr:hypothetical protein [Blastococcus sp. TF02-9]
MNRLRRSAVLLGLTAAVIVGSSIPASATFTDAVSTNTAVLQAGTVAAPAAVTVDDYCSTTSYSYWNGTSTVTVTDYWYNATVSWPASTTQRGVTGYRVMAHLNNGQSVVMGETGTTNRSVSARVDRGYLGYQPRVSVITLTSYGWTTESARTAVLTC